VQLGLAAPSDARLPSPTAQFAVTPPMVVAQVAQPSPDDYKRADAIAERIPDAVRTLAGQRDAVMPLLLGLLLDEGQRVATLLCVVAQCGHEDKEIAKRAYLTGIQRVLPSDHLPYLPRALGALALEEVWGPLDGLDPLAKQSLVEGITATIGHDNQVTVGEAELLRTICAALHCPLPPMLETAPRAR